MINLLKPSVLGSTPRPDIGWKSGETRCQPLSWTPEPYCWPNSKPSGFCSTPIPGTCCWGDLGQPIWNHRGAGTVWPRESCVSQSNWCSLYPEILDSPAGIIWSNPRHLILSQRARWWPREIQCTPHSGPQESSDWVDQGNLSSLHTEEGKTGATQLQMICQRPKLSPCQGCWGHLVNCMPESSGYSQVVTHQRNCAHIPTITRILSMQLRYQISGRSGYNTEQRQ